MGEHAGLNQISALPLDLAIASPPGSAETGPALQR